MRKAESGWVQERVRGFPDGPQPQEPPQPLCPVTSGKGGPRKLHGPLELGDAVACLGWEQSVGSSQLPDTGTEAAGGTAGGHGRHILSTLIQPEA